jgi:hypothetical protein
MPQDALFRVKIAVWITRLSARCGVWLSTFIAVILGAMLSGCATTPSLADELTAIASNPPHRLASLSVLAIRDGRVVYERQFGDRFVATATDAAKPANGQTMYDRFIRRS